MSEPFIAEIRIFGCNFAPRGWAFCNGQIMQIRQNTALFSLLGTTYGGDGKVTYGLPDLQARAPMFYGQGPGLSSHVIGEMAGSQTVTLLNVEMPAHNHGGAIIASAGNRRGNFTDPTGNTLAGGSTVPLYDAPATKTMSPTVMSPDGNGAPHENMQPYLVLNFCIALQGIFPSRP